MAITSAEPAACVGPHPPERLSSWDNPSCLTLHRHFRLAPSCWRDRRSRACMVFRFRDLPRSLPQREQRGQSRGPMLAWSMSLLQPLPWAHKLNSWVHPWHGASMQASQICRDRMLHYQLAMNVLHRSKRWAFLRLQRYSYPMSCNSRGLQCVVDLKWDSGCFKNCQNCAFKPSLAVGVTYAKLARIWQLTSGVHLNICPSRHRIHILFFVNGRNEMKREPEE